MTKPSPFERLHDQLQDAAERRSQTSAEAVRRVGTPPSEGDLYAFPETAEAGVLWAVVKSEEGRGLFVVPFDCQLLEGTADIALDATSSFGSGVLRCAFGEWLHLEAFSRADLCGILEPEIQMRVHERRQFLETGQRPSSLLLRETDEMLDYRERMVEVESACEALQSVSSSEVAPQAPAREELSGKTPVVRQGPWRNVRQIYALAASVLLPLLVIGLLGKNRQLEMVRIENERARADAERKLERLEAAAADGRREQQRLSKEVKRLLAESPERRLVPMSGMPVKFLSPREALRSAEDIETIEMPPRASLLVLSLYSSRPVPEGSLEAVFLTREEEWVVERMEAEATGPHEVNLVLPAGVLEPGEYWLDLYAEEEGRLAEYAVAIVESEEGIPR